MLSLFLLALLSLTTLVSAARALPSHPSAAHALSKRGSPAQINAFLFAHNVIREAHAAPDLTWSTELASLAEEWADNCVFQRTEGILRETPYGELHVAATGVFPISNAINQFVLDEVEYNPAKPTYNHWTQIVWKSTTEVGCARSQCDNMLGHATGVATYYVCLYNPAGNIIGQASENVSKLL
ncbi:putative SCP / Tpx-1 / Ag5 / PR-1 / Sc7 family of extracellular domains containing protein [Lyophyllum shimeji]|uniref:SCP / Tpx-1 / Ag5 / PR-1 / Sc7 family of extracellular domains containing protein n=1 Tax=Lyophyllum shimeji TaxID=47721 RepID=A0A9P3PEL1_LYOSH|nr:putative SCP / Tpx-1 / Ag5 / PR-1 / Sc7 family of extracellular domains containing protein [Lyophyllum shimeji]